MRSTCCVDSFLFRPGGRHCCCSPQVIYSCTTMLFARYSLQEAGLEVMVMVTKIMLLALLLAASAAFGEIYTWKDLRGTVHYTNSIYEIPARYQKKVRVLDLGMGQGVDQAIVQPDKPVPPAQSSAQSAVQGSAEKPIQQNAAGPQPSDNSERIRRLRDSRQQERLLMRRTPSLPQSSPP